ncbi:hypothetical protein COHA_004591 [Chlorella ohadii]|uniref:Zinc knuckle-domain-containing protein n=1 Tax=Chlorella ohadii TaxID=2649997 RepID=A0AAD5DTF1_9CHLO|nr:hypothetical protein COHA_004591 [Chlorella ohadii]
MSLYGSGAHAMAGRYKSQGRFGQGQAGGAPTCQRCLQQGHWTYECKNEPVYQSRPTRTQQLKNPRVRARFLDASELPPELRDKEPPGAGGKGKSKGEAEGKGKKKRKRRAYYDEGGKRNRRSRSRERSKRRRSRS